MTLVDFIECVPIHTRSLDLKISQAINGVPEGAKFISDWTLPTDRAWYRGVSWDIPNWTGSVDAVLRELNIDAHWRISQVRSHSLGVTATTIYNVEIYSIMAETARGMGHSFNLALCAAMIRAKIEKDDRIS